MRVVIGGLKSRPPYSDQIHMPVTGASDQTKKTKTKNTKNMNNVREHDFWMPMKKVPTTTHQMKATKVVKGKVIHYEPPKVAETRAKLMAALSSHIPDRWFGTGPLECTVKWCFPHTQKTKKLNREFVWKSTKPDTHNLNKMLFDCMTDLQFWKDDAQVASEIIQKAHADRTGIYIKIENL